MTGLGLVADLVVLYLGIHAFFALVYLFFKIKGDDLE